MICGHNICRECLIKYSATDHPKSSVRCEICNIETKVFLMAVSIPNRAMSKLLHDVEKHLGFKLMSGKKLAAAKKRGSLDQSINAI